MSRTTKWEHKSDTWRIGHRLELKARPAGRLVAVVEQEFAAEVNSNNDNDE